MKKLFITLICFLTFVPVLVLAQSDYIPLEPSLFDNIQVSEAGENQLSDYIQKGFYLFLIVSVTLSILLIMVGGVEIIFSQVPNVKVQGKSRIYSALMGLGLALASVLLLTILNPSLVNLKFNAAEIASAPVTTPPTGGGPTGTSTNPTDPGPTSCLTCQALTGINCSSPSECQTDPRTAPKLQAMDTALDASGVDWIVTEGYPPSYGGHKNDCHRRGTCIDADISNPTPENLRAFSESATNAGLLPVYEVSTQSEKQQLRNSGYTGTVCVFTHITGSHFSVYNPDTDTVNTSGPSCQG